MHLSELHLRRTREGSSPVSERDPEAFDGWFRCAPYDITTRRVRCARDHKDATLASQGREPPGVRAMNRVQLLASRNACIGCEVGAAHARRERHPNAPDIARPCAVDPKLLTRMRRKDGVECPACGVRSPKYDRGSWARAWGHRCPHDEPCPGATGLEKPPCCGGAPSEAAPEHEPPAAPPPVENVEDHEEAPMATKTCETCGDEFEGHGRAKFCSDECRPSATKRQARARGRKAAASSLDDVVARATRRNSSGGGGRSSEPCARAPRARRLRSPRSEDARRRRALRGWR